MTTSIAVVTVCYNAEADIERTLQSVQSQQYGAVEHIVVDGASTDGTLAILDAYRSRLAALVSEPDAGLYDAMNKGWKLARSDVVGFLNAGDVFQDSAVLFDVARAFDESGADAVYGDLDLISAKGEVVRRWKSGDFRRAKYHLGWMTPHPATYVRRILFERFGGFRDDLSIAADYELMLRFFFRHRARVSYLPRPFVRMLAGGLSNGSVLGILRANVQVYRSWRKNGLLTSPTILLTKPLSKLLQLRAR